MALSAANLPLNRTDAFRRLATVFRTARHLAQEEVAGASRPSFDAVVRRLSNEIGEHLRYDPLLGALAREVPSGENLHLVAAVIGLRNDHGRLAHRLGNAGRDESQGSPNRHMLHAVAETLADTAVAFDEADARWSPAPAPDPTLSRTLVQFAGKMTALATDPRWPAPSRQVHGVAIEDITIADGERRFPISYLQKRVGGTVALTADDSLPRGARLLTLPECTADGPAGVAATGTALAMDRLVSARNPSLPYVVVSLVPERSGRLRALARGAAGLDFACSAGILPDERGNKSALVAYTRRLSAS
jgi:hypothetical protein